MKLVLIPCPISENSATQVLPKDVIDYLKITKHFLVENIRTARRFISELKLEIVIDELIFEVLDKDTAKQTILQFFKLHANASYIGVLSEAGCPGVADPGALAVQIAHELNIEVLPLVGPSSILLALMGSGFSGQSFTFHGYLPIDKNARQKKIEQICQEAVKFGQTQLFIETPFRNNALLEDLVLCVPAHLSISIACELTSPTGFSITKSAQAWKKEIPELHKKPCIFLIGQ